MRRSPEPDDHRIVCFQLAANILYKVPPRRQRELIIAARCNIFPDQFSEGEVDIGRFLMMSSEVFIRPVNFPVKVVDSDHGIGDNIFLKKLGYFVFLEKNEIGPVAVKFEEETQIVVEQDLETSFIVELADRPDPAPDERLEKVCAVLFCPLEIIRETQAAELWQKGRLQEERVSMGFKPDDQFVFVLTKTFGDNRILYSLLKGGTKGPEKVIVVVHTLALSSKCPFYSVST